MADQSRVRGGGIKARGLKQKKSSNALNAHVDEQPVSNNELNTLRNLLWSSQAVEEILWNFRTKDWVSAIRAADIDNDGDAEILICSRDGYVRALTRRGAVKWETYFAGEQLSTLYSVPSSLLSQGTLAGPQQLVSVIVGTRSGKVMALDQRGERVPNWEYNTDRIIRKVHISEKKPESVIVGSEDRCIHILNRDTGKLLYEKVPTGGWVRSVFSCDIDGDGRDEILAGSGDKYLYILDDQGVYLDRLYIGHQIYALFAAPLKVGGPIHVVTSSNRKDLVVWHVMRKSEKRWTLRKIWEKSPRDGLFGNRVHSIYMEDINKDGYLEIMLGSEDAHLYILDYQGTLLWKHHFTNCVYSVDAKDIDFDNQIEILVGTEDSSAYALRIDLTDKLHLYNHIRDGYQSLVEASNVQNGNEMMIIKELTPKERTILRDLIKYTHIEHHAQMEMSDAINLMEKRFYEQALAIFLRLLQEKVQYYWMQPLKTQGYIWTLDFAKISADGKYDIVVGTDEGQIYAFDTERAEDKQLWATQAGDRVRMLQAGALKPMALDSIVAVLASHRVVILDHNGKIVKDHTFEDKQDWARSVYLNKHGSDSNPVSDMVIGLENNKVAIWDNHLQKKIRVIDTPQGISTAVTCDLPGKNTSVIISGSLKNHVYVHDWEGNELWRFETQDRVQELCVADIDKDGYIEVIVGAEDRYVYVLNENGHLKWRYRTMRGVIDVDVCDMKLENDPDDESKRKLKLLVSSSDGYLYVFSDKGDLLWKYQSHNRIRSARAADVNNDGRYEIALATENQLELLQIINRKELYEYIQQCWRELEDPDDRRGSIMRLTRHPNGYIRGYALARLAGQRQHHEDDFKRLQEARDDDSSEVKKELVRAIVNLCQVAVDVAQYRKENISLARLLIQKLSLDPDLEIRLAIVDVLAFMANIEEGLCFEYLEYFAHNIDAWVRRAVVRELDKLVERYPERAFRLLLKTAMDEDDWIRQETGRVLAHYFDRHPQVLIRDMLTLLYKRVDPVVLRQIADSAWVPAIAGLFDNLFKLLTTEDVPEMISDFVNALRTANQLEPFSGEALLQLYEEFHQLLHIKTVNTIARHQWITANSDITENIPYQNISHILRVFGDLAHVVEIVKTYERRETMGDQATSLFAATEALDKIRTYVQQEEMRQSQGNAKTYTLPEYSVLTMVLAQWYKAITTEFHHLRGGASLVAEIRNRVVRPEEEIVVSLLITNTGHSPADNVHIILERSDDFRIVSNNTRSFSEVSTSKPVTTDFTIQPCMPSPRLSFQLIYDDAERKAKIEHFADIVTLQGQQRPYLFIPNPYTSGTPIRDEKMFFGRQDDIEDLYDKLGSTSANKVVVLYGQRRMGKTSLLYQLANKLADGPYAPVLIDFQSLALKSNVGQFLLGIASHIQEELRNHKHIDVAKPDSVVFNSNPTTAFDDFLHTTLQAIPDCKLVFLLDEFEKLYDLIQKGLLEENILNYLRSLMQHRERLNFLLAGTPHILDLTEGYWAIFFNIALQHPLSKLKPQEAIDLITQPIGDYMEYDVLALERVRYLSGDQPYLIHIISEKLIAHCNKHEKTYVTVNDVNTVLEHILYEQAISIRWIWKQSSPDERFLLSILAQEKGEEGRSFSLNDIRVEYDREGIVYEQQKVIKALHKMVRDDFVEERRDGTQYRIPVGLLKEWLRKAKSPERVVREEGLGEEEFDEGESGEES